MLEFVFVFVCVMFESVVFHGDSVVVYWCLYLVLNIVLFCDFGDLRCDFCIECDLSVMLWGYLYGEVLVSFGGDCLGEDVGWVG